MESVLNTAIEAVKISEISYCKFLSPNDTKATKAHQSGYLLGKNSWPLFFKKDPGKGDNLKVDISINWQKDFETSSTITYYGAIKNEIRLTRFGRNFPFREDNNVGDLFILCKVGAQSFNAFILSLDEEIEQFFLAFNISTLDSNNIIPKQFELSLEQQLLDCFASFTNNFGFDFPTTFELSSAARNCYNVLNNIDPRLIKENPDSTIINWLNTEFKLFKIIEKRIYSDHIQKPFASVDDLVDIANTILNRRKSRAGKSLEHHLADIFRIFDVSFSMNAKTEGNKKPDFVFPNIESYHNINFDNNKLIILASKTTCKDRWRQILNEADRVKLKHLFTLQQGISSSQLGEMYKYNVRLVVPAPLLSTFPKEYHSKILTLNKFIQLVM